MSPALRSRVEICNAASAFLSLPVILYDRAHAFRGEIFDLVVKLLGRADGIAENANAITMLTQAVLPEPASMHGLNPFDLESVQVRGYLLRARRIGLAAISQVREVHHSVAMGIVNTQPLPVICHAVDITDDPDHLGHMMVDGGIKLRRICASVLSDIAGGESEKCRAGVLSVVCAGASLPTTKAKLSIAVHPKTNLEQGAVFTLPRAAFD